MKVLKGQVEAVIRIAQAAQDSITVVRDSFTTGIPPIQVVNSGSIANYIQQLGKSTDAQEIVSTTSRLGLSTAMGKSGTNVPRPELDVVEIANDPSYGMLDGFYARIVGSLSVGDVDRVSCMRILRAQIDTPGGNEPSAPSFSALIDGGTVGGSRKSPDQVYAQAQQVSQIGKGNVITDFVVSDPNVPQKNVVSKDRLRKQPDPINTNRTGPTPSALVSMENVDKGVLESLAFTLNNRAIDVPSEISLPVRIGRSTGIDILRGGSINKNKVLVESNNSSDFREVGRVPVSRKISRTVGSFIEIEFFDPSVVFGATYIYYVVMQNEQGIDSLRSRFVTVTIAKREPPATPIVQYSVVASVPRFTFKSPSGFIDHFEVFRRGGARFPKRVRVIGGKNAPITMAAPTVTAAGFRHMGDVGSSRDRSATFIDNLAIPGETLEYRIYSVDSFGNKSQTPFECTVRLADIGEMLPIVIPTITAESGMGRRSVLVTVSTEDPRATSFMLKRREVGNFERAYHQPDQPERVTLGSVDAKRAGSRIGARLINVDRSWTGVLKITSGSATLTDTAVGFDRTYQYTVQTVDVRGKLSSHAHSQYVTVYDRPVIDMPTDLVGKVSTDEQGTLSGVVLTWRGGTHDMSPNDLIGDQDVLAATSVRSVYQVERREKGGSVWEVMPAVTGSEFVDPVSTAEAPVFRPSYALPLHTYDYRVIAMQSGGLISNYTEPVRVEVTPELLSPGTIWVRSTHASISPLAVIVSWNYSGDLVDSWEIQRAVTNKVFGSRIPSMDSDEARSLEYTDCAIVTRESSQAQPVQSEQPRQKESIGNRMFADYDVDVINSYFYRIRARHNDSASGWSYAGIVLTDSPSERKIESATSDRDRRLLALSSDPISSIGSRPVNRRKK